jgi:hypothetical protein
MNKKGPIAMTNCVLMLLLFPTLLVVLLALSHFILRSPSADSRLTLTKRELNIFLFPISSTHHIGKNKNKTMSPGFFYASNI